MFTRSGVILPICGPPGLACTPTACDDGATGPCDAPTAGPPVTGSAGCDLNASGDCRPRKSGTNTSGCSSVPSSPSATRYLDLVRHHDGGESFVSVRQLPRRVAIE